MRKREILFRLFLVLFLCFHVLFSEIKVYGEEKPENLHALSAVLMDAESGRILYTKEGEKFMANASTTKILTCILALEEGDRKDYVKISKYAASMPDVQLNVGENEEYLLEDLLYSLMLESHNDTAAAIAEHLEGSCESFSKKMNEKARQIGCKNTYFLTPNGLDAVRGERYHGTTAEDLALLMRYCVMESPKKEEFLKITRTPEYSFSDKEGKRIFHCYNRNSFLNMMEGALSGKTGYTSKAGYCYVGALQREERTFIVALLGSGWPGNRNYKWEDSRKLFQYGIENYRLFSLEECEPGWEEILHQEVLYGKNEEGNFSRQIFLEKQKKEEEKILLKEGEKIRIKIWKKQLTAPVKKGELAGTVTYLIDEIPWVVQNLMIGEDVEKIDYLWCLKQIIKLI